jgi:anti-anti-sigma regulatory factor
VISSRESRPVFFALVAPTEPVEGEGVPRFGEQLEQAIAAGSTRLLVDLRRAGAVGTGALNALLRARGLFLRQGGRIALVAQPRVRRFCESTGLDRRFLLADDRMGAAHALGLVAASEARDFRPKGVRAA